MSAGAPTEADRLILEAASGAQRLTLDELSRVQAHIAEVGFDPAAQEQAGGRVAGLSWRGRALMGSDWLVPAERITCGTRSPVKSGHREPR